MIYMQVQYKLVQYSTVQYSTVQYIPEDNAIESLEDIEEIIFGKSWNTLKNKLAHILM